MTIKTSLKNQPLVTTIAINVLIDIRFFSNNDNINYVDGDLSNTIVSFDSNITIIFTIRF